MNFLWAFCVGGVLCAVAEMVVCKTRLTPARILVGYVVAGVFLSAGGLYGRLVSLASCGATVPLTGFGHLLARGVERAVDEQGLLGVLTGGLSACAGGVTVAVCCGLLVSLLCKPHKK